MQTVGASLKGYFMTNEEIKYSVCTHEAAHCVTRFFLFAEALGAVVFDGNQGGMATQDPEAAKPVSTDSVPTAKEQSIFQDEKTTIRDLMNDAVFTVSGYVAQNIILGDTRFSLYADNPDARWISGRYLACCPDATSEEITAFLFLAETRARRVVRQYQKYIERVALRLNQRGMLSDGEVLAAMWPDRVILS